MNVANSERKTGSQERLRSRIEELETENRHLKEAFQQRRVCEAGSGTQALVGEAATAREVKLPLAETEAGRVSVVIPVFNGRKFLAPALHSIWKQDFPLERIEVLICDDGSRDGSFEQAKELVNQAPVSTQLLHHPQHQNRGVAATRNLGLSAARGEWIALLDVDDTFHPSRLRRSVETFAEHPGIGLVCSLGRNVDAQAQAIRGYNGFLYAGEFAGMPSEPAFQLSAEQLWKHYSVANSSITVRKDLICKIGGYAENMAHQAEDFYLVLKAAFASSVWMLREVLFDYVQHTEAYTQAYLNEDYNWGVRLEVFYNTCWWLFQQEHSREQAERFFREHYKTVVAGHGEVLPLLAAYYTRWGAAACGSESLGGFCRELLERNRAMDQVLQLLCKQKGDPGKPET